MAPAGYDLRAMMHALLLMLACQAPVQLLEASAPQATLRFAVRDAQGGFLPSRLTFRGPGGIGAQLFTRTDAAAEELAVRKNVVYTLSGKGAITVPTGRYRVFATRGLEWSLAEAEFDFEAGREYRFDAVLRREIDSTGWISGDFHLHTLTHSGHGDSNLRERVISLIGEGVEFAVATDHNHNTDYGPELEALQAVGQLAHVTGNEVTTPIGHFNAFPLDPRRPPVDASLRDANELFRIVRAEPNPQAVVPVIQLNHPRYVAIDWFGETGLDPVTGTSGNPNWSDAFDALEIFNANASWGYFDAETVANQGPSVHSALTDWFHLLNRGHRHAAVGNSDSHTVHYEFAGFPRNFLQLGIDAVPQIKAAAVVEAIRAKRLFTTTGPFVNFMVNGEPPGSQIRAAGHRLSVRIRVQAASWCDVDRVKLIVNGDPCMQWSVPQDRQPLRFEQQLDLDVVRDAWLVVLVEGDDPIDPLVEEQKDRCLPLAVTNPIWIDADGDGRFVPLWQKVREEARGGEWQPAFAARGPFEQGLLCLAAVEEGRGDAADLIAAALASEAREVLLCAARAAEKLGTRAPVAALEAAWVRCRSRDGYLQLSLVRALQSAKAPGWERKLPEAVAAMLDRAHLHADELQRAFAWRWIERWESVATGLQASVHAPDAREVFFALGAEGEAALLINGVEVARHAGKGPVDRPQVFGRAALIQGANRIEIRKQNRPGALGARLGVLDSDLELPR